jgi:hydrogenase-4 component B
MAIAGLPPLNGFASEWLTLQSLLHLAVYGQLGVAFAGALSTVALAATAALAVYCFVKVIGLVALGEPRRAECAQARETSATMRGPLVLLAGLCVILGVIPGLLVPTLAKLAPRDVHLPVRPGIDIAGTGGLPAPALALALVVVVGALWRAGRARRAAVTPAWACGQLVEPPLRWTSAAFTKPLRLMFEPVLRPTRELSARSERGVVQEIRFEAEVPHLFDTMLYEPVTRLALRGAATARRLQSGSLRTYLIYLLGLLMLIIALVRLGALS